MAEIILHRLKDFEGGSRTFTNDNRNLKNEGVNDFATSVEVTSGTFTLFEHVDFKGNSLTVCATGGPNSDGKYPEPKWLAGKDNQISSLKKNSDQPV